MNEIINLLKQSEQIELSSEWIEFADSLQFMDEPPHLEWD